MIEASSPAKAILFGEHAVVYGKPAIAVALDRRMTIRVVRSERFSVDRRPLSIRRNRYAKWALENLYDGPPLAVTTSSSIPSASGLGSSAALSCSIAAAIRQIGGGMSIEGSAGDAFEIEYNVQGRASPTDTSASAHGGGILVSSKEGDGRLWSLSKGDRIWHVHNLSIPPMTLVVGFTRKPSVTPIQVEKVANFYMKSNFARETIEEIGDLVWDAVKALKDRDLVRVGGLMDRNNSLLTILGVNSKELQKLKDAAAPHSYGAKLTGAGGGGSMIALTDSPQKVAASIERRGGVPFIVSISDRGVSASGSIDQDGH